MFMKNVMKKSKCMTDVLQKEELDISGALISMNSMLEILEPVRKDDKNQRDMIKMILT